MLLSYFVDIFLSFEVGRLLVLKFSCLKELRAWEELEITVVYRFVIILVETANESCVDYLLPPSQLGTEELSEGRPNFENASELLLHKSREMCAVLCWCGFCVLLGYNLGDVYFGHDVALSAERSPLGLRERLFWS